MPFPDSLITDPLYSRLKEHLVESTGLTYYSDKDVDLARRVGRRLLIMGARDCAAYLDILRDLKRVNAHLAAAAYPILEGRGELLPSRLRHDAE